MRILYGIQGTGNGHLSRARALLPIITKFADVDVLISGNNFTANFPYPVKFQRNGLSYVFGKNGGIDFRRSIRNFNVLTFFKDLKNLSVTAYDLVISDFDPLTSWACAWRNVPCVGISHQAAFFSEKTPRPEVVERVPELIFTHFAPCDRAIGFHYKAYDHFIHTPLIRDEIRNATISKKNHLTVYLPAYEESLLVPIFSKIKFIDWHVFCRARDEKSIFENVKLFPVSETDFTESAATSSGMLLASGFESTSEALFLGKKLFTIPMIGQYEQKCNAAALIEFGATTAEQVDDSLHLKLLQWLDGPNPYRLEYPVVTYKIAEEILESNLTQTNVIW